MAVAELSIPALFLAGVASSPHCGLMCGALQAHGLRLRGSLPAGQALGCMHGGRVLGYALAGGLAGAAGAALLAQLPGREIGMALQLAAALLLIVSGALLIRASARAAPCSRPAVPHALAGLSPSLRMLAQGIVWSLLPCGLLYAMLFLALASGSALSGAVLLAAFGLGTVPLTAAGGLALDRLRSAHAVPLRRVAAGLMIALGVGAASMLLLQDTALGAWCVSLL